MFDFKELRVIKENESQFMYGSFVGIRKDKYTNEMIFNLPKGFDDFEINYENIKTLFFRMYKTFKIFHLQKKSMESKLIDSNPQSKDNISIQNTNGAYTFADSENNEVLLYSKLDIIDDILTLYNDLEIESIIQEVGLVDDIDYSKIDALLRNGVFLKNNAIIVDDVVGEKSVIRGVPSDLVELYCFIYKEILSELDEDVNERVKDIAFNFAQKHLTSNQSLFNEYSFNSTLLILKDCLDIIDRNTAYKDFIYWSIFEAVEQFLYGGLSFDSQSTQGFWGINNFSSIWEDMCNLFWSKDKDSRLVFCDTDINLSNCPHNNLIRKNYGSRKVYHDEHFENNFKIELDGNIRWMRPDLIIEPAFSQKVSYFLDNNIIRYKTFVERNNIFSTMGLGFVNAEFNLKQDADLTPQMVLVAQLQFNRLFNFFETNSKSNWRSKKPSKHEFQVRRLSQTKFKLLNITEHSLDSFLADIRRIDEYKNNDIHDVFVIDWKYVSTPFFKKQSNKLRKDIIKQLTYELCLSNNNSYKDKKIKSQFGIPYYLDDSKTIEEYEWIEGIEIVKVNFSKVQEVYLNEYRV